ncbi:unnamed protein product [Dracunculus medinensis]|uniref:ShKT domain-containing protein n=1 Tax=Dracunculus medinensis TaxID=318479 RepID=A0A0N4US48_DRAME|nr:unnamed protein product [Dracunculus medinensis]
MLGSLFMLTSLCYLSNGDDVPINICFVPVRGANNAIVRPSVPVEYCQDRDAAACFAIFKPEDDNVLAQNPTTLPSSAATCRDERQHCAAIRAANSCGGVFRTTMMQQCARTCGYCV